MEENLNNADNTSIETMDDLDALLNEDTSTTSVPTKVEEPVEETPAEEPTQVEEPKETPKPTDGGVVTEGNTDKANQAFAQMRLQLKAQDEMFKKLADARGISVDSLKEQLNKEAVEKKAAQLNVTPEVYERLSKLESENKAQKEELEALKDKEYKDQQARLLTQNIEQVQKEQGLSDDQVREFVKETVAQGMDILNGRIPLTILYKGMYFDKLVETKIEEAKQEVIKQYDKADKHAANTVKDSGNVNKDANTITDMAALNALLDK